MVIHALQLECEKSMELTATLLTVNCQRQCVQGERFRFNSVVYLLVSFVSYSLFVYSIDSQPVVREGFPGT